MITIATRPVIAQAAVAITATMITKGETPEGLAAGAVEKIPARSAPLAMRIIVTIGTATSVAGEGEHKDTFMYSSRPTPIIMTIINSSVFISYKILLLLLLLRV